MMTDYNSFGYRAWVMDALENGRQSHGIMVEVQEIEFHRLERSGWRHITIKYGEELNRRVSTRFVLLRNACCTDILGNQVYEGDILRSRMNGMLFVVKFGIHRAYCELDNQWMHSVGFYAESRLGQYPLGNPAEWADRIGNVYENPDLLQINYYVDAAGRLVTDGEQSDLHRFAERAKIPRDLYREEKPGYPYYQLPSPALIHKVMERGAQLVHSKWIYRIWKSKFPDGKPGPELGLSG